MMMVMVLFVMLMHHEFHHRAMGRGSWQHRDAERP